MRRVAASRATNHQPHRHLQKHYIFMQYVVGFLVQYLHLPCRHPLLDSFGRECSMSYVFPIRWNSPSVSYKDAKNQAANRCVESVLTSTFWTGNEGYANTTLYMPTSNIPNMHIIQYHSIAQVLQKGLIWHQTMVSFSACRSLFVAFVKLISVDEITVSKYHTEHRCQQMMPPIGSSPMVLRCKMPCLRWSSTSMAGARAQGEDNESQFISLWISSKRFIRFSSIIMLS